MFDPHHFPGFTAEQVKRGLTVPALDPTQAPPAHQTPAALYSVARERATRPLGHARRTQRRTQAQGVRHE